MGERGKAGTKNASASGTGWSSIEYSFFPPSILSVCHRHKDDVFSRRIEESSRVPVTRFSKEALSFCAFKAKRRKSHFQKIGIYALNLGGRMGFDGHWRRMQGHFDL